MLCSFCFFDLDDANLFVCKIIILQSIIIMIVVIVVVVVAVTDSMQLLKNQNENSILMMNWGLKDIKSLLYYNHFTTRYIVQDAIAHSTEQNT